MRTLVCVLCCAFVWTGQVWADGPTEVMVQKLAVSEKSWNGATLPAYPEGQPEVTILRIVIPPKVELPVHLHPVINAGVLLKGELTVTTEKGQVLRLEPGDPIVEVVDTWHKGKNPGQVPAEIIVFYAGVAGSPISLKQE